MTPEERAEKIIEIYCDRRRLIPFASNEDVKACAAQIRDAQEDIRREFQDYLKQERKQARSEGFNAAKEKAIKIAGDGLQWFIVDRIRQMEME